MIFWYLPTFFHALAARLSLCLSKTLILFGAFEEIILWMFQIENKMLY